MKGSDKMNNLSNQELININGGGIKLSVGAFLGVSAIVSFIIGAVNGFLRPLTCSSKE